MTKITSNNSGSQEIQDSIADNKALSFPKAPKLRFISDNIPTLKHLGAPIEVDGKTHVAFIHLVMTPEQKKALILLAQKQGAISDAPNVPAATDAVINFFRKVGATGSDLKHGGWDLVLDRKNPKKSAGTIHAKSIMGSEGQLPIPGTTTLVPTQIHEHFETKPKNTDTGTLTDPEHIGQTARFKIGLNDGNRADLYTKDNSDGQTDKKLFIVGHGIGINRVDHEIDIPKGHTLAFTVPTAFESSVMGWASGDPDSNSVQRILDKQPFALKLRMFDETLVVAYLSKREPLSESSTAPATAIDYVKAAIGQAEHPGKMFELALHSFGSPRESKLSYDANTATNVKAAHAYRDDATTREYAKAALNEKNTDVMVPKGKETVYTRLGRIETKIQELGLVQRYDEVQIDACRPNMGESLGDWEPLKDNLPQRNDIQVVAWAPDQAPEFVDPNSPQAQAWLNAMNVTQSPQGPSTSHSEAPPRNDDEITPEE